ncbi:hypothetical protein ACIBL8_33390 [Streptomyces sp. NPDC050523]|uniref:hypothetical protein n=1 Tax=Streptomyces sp. NPDC050523 TaxID=3365622 RepID=UPI0037A686F5
MAHDLVGGSMFFRHVCAFLCLCLFETFGLIQNSDDDPIRIVIEDRDAITVSAAGSFDFEFNLEEVAEAPVPEVRRVLHEIYDAHPGTGCRLRIPASSTGDHVRDLFC